MQILILVSTVPAIVVPYIVLVRLSVSCPLARDLYKFWGGGGALREGLNACCLWEGKGGGWGKGAAGEGGRELISRRCPSVIFFLEAFALWDVATTGKPCFGLQSDLPNNTDALRCEKMTLRSNLQKCETGSPPSYSEQFEFTLVLTELHPREHEIVQWNRSLKIHLRCLISNTVVSK